VERNEEVEIERSNLSQASSLLDDLLGTVEEGLQLKKYHWCCDSLGRKSRKGTKKGGESWKTIR